MARPMKKPPKPIAVPLSPTGERLSVLRKRKGLSQESLAQAMGISRKQITDYETGRVHMNDEMIIRFALMLKVSTDTLLGLKEFDFPVEKYNLRFTKRLRELEELPEPKKRAIIKVLDELVKST